MANDTFTGGFSAGDILYEDNHLIAVNKRAGQLVQSDTAGEPGLEEMIKAFIKERDGKTNRAHAYASPRGDAKEAVLRYRLLGGSKNYRLLEVELITGRHHQIRCQLAKAGCPIKGDLKYGAPRSNPGGGISLHSRSLSFVHPVRREPLTITAPVPKEDSLWSFFEKSQGGDE